MITSKIEALHIVVSLINKYNIYKGKQIRFRKIILYEIAI